MEYASCLTTGEPIYNNELVKHVGFEENADMRAFFSRSNVQKISNKITELLQGVDEYNRPIRVTDNVITNVMSSVYDSFLPKTGDIFTRYIIPQETGQNYLRTLTDRAINIIVTNIRNEMEMAQNNAKLTVWTTVLGDFNEHGLRSHSRIKLREKRPQPMAFNMNY